MSDLSPRMRQKAWIERISQVSGHSYSRIAKECNLAQTTISRFMDDAQSSNALSARTEEKIRARYSPLLDEEEVSLSGPLASHMALPKQSHLDGSYGMVQIPEYDIEVSAGAGMSVPDLQNPSKVWVVPRAALENAQVSSLDNLAILTIRGDSMVPKYAPGDRVLVDRGDNVVRHDGSYVLWNQFGLIVKMVQVLPAVSESGPVFRIISKNKDYPPYECPAKDAQIHGRVVGRWVWE